MTYVELRKQYDAARKEQAALHRESKRLEGELEGIGQKYNKIREEREVRMANDRAVRLEEYRKERKKPVEEQLAKVTERLEKATARYKDARGEITFDNVMREVATKQEILESVRGSSSVLSEKLKEIVGDAFYRKLYDSLNSDSFRISEEDMPQLVEYFNKSEGLMEGWANGKGAFEKGIDSLENLLAQDDERVSLVVLVLSVVILLFWTRLYAFGYLIIITIYAVFHILRSHRVYKTLLVQLAVQQNIDKIDATLKAEIDAEVQRRIEELDNTLGEKIHKLEDKEKTLTEDLAAMDMEASSTFKYDPSHVDRQLQAEKESLDFQNSSLLSQKQDIDNQLRSKGDLVRTLYEQLKASMGDVVAQYTEGIGKETVFDGRFLWDLDEVKGKPIFWDHPKKSCLFIVDYEDDAIAFSQLILTQLRSKLSPHSQSSTVYDHIRNGIDFEVFAKAVEGLEQEQMNMLFSIFSSKNEMKQRIEFFGDELKKRQQTIIVEAGTIEQYNQNMLASGSLTELYYFFFLISPEPELIKEDTMLRLLRVGGDVGIYTHIFLSKETISAMKASALEILNAVGKVFYLTKTECKSRAVSFVQGDLLSDS